MGFNLGTSSNTGKLHMTDFLKCRSEYRKRNTYKSARPMGKSAVQNVQRIQAA